MNKTATTLVRVFRVLLTVVVLSYAGLAIYALLFANRMIFPMPEASYKADINNHKIVLSSGERISVKYTPASEAYFTVLYSHGNLEDLGIITGSLLAFNAEGYSTLAYEYPGYGISTGEPSERNVYESIEAIYDYAIHTLKIPSERIILYGRSLGSGPSVELATRNKVGGVILEGAFVSTFRVVTVYPILFWDVFNNIRKIRKINAPLLVIHGTEDVVVPFWHGKKLYETALSPKESLWIEGAGHNNLAFYKGYWNAVNSFLNTIKAEQEKQRKNI